MGLFDRLFGKKEETEKVLPSTEEVMESNEIEEVVKEEPTRLPEMTRKSKKSLIWRHTTKSLKLELQPTHQPVSTVTQEESAEEPLLKKS